MSSFIFPLIVAVAVCSLSGCLASDKLRYAVWENDTVKIEQRLAAGADVNDTCPLGWAANKGHMESIKLLIDRGARIDNDGRVRDDPSC